MAILGYKYSFQSNRTVGLADWLEKRGLPGWLDVATDGLEEAAKERVTREIQAHYAEALNAHMAAGETELSAQTAALAELGDPVDARVEFAKTHLTISDGKWIRRWEQMASNRLFCFRTVSLTLIDLSFFAPVVVLCLPAHTSWFDLQVFIFWFILFIGFRLVPRMLYSESLPHQVLLKRLGLCNSITMFAWVFSFGLTNYMQSPDFFSASWFILYGFVISRRYWYFWKKIRKSVNEQDSEPRSTLLPRDSSDHLEG